MKIAFHVRLRLCVASKCSGEDLDGFPLLWHSSAQRQLEASEIGGFRGNFLVLSHANEISTFCQSELLPKGNEFQHCAKLHVVTVGARWK